jgi:hypothetical protein
LQDLFHALHAGIRVDELDGAGLQVGGFRSGVQNFQGQGFQASAASQIGERLLFRLERQIDVFQTTERIRRLDQRRQLVRQFALRLQGFQDPLLAVGQRAPFFHGLVDQPDLLFVQPARSVLSVTGNEGDGVAIVQQFNGSLYFFDRQVDIAGDLRQIWIQRGFHRGPD